MTVQVLLSCFVQKIMSIVPFPFGSWIKYEFDSFQEAAFEQICSLHKNDVMKFYAWNNNEEPFAFEPALLAHIET